MVSQLFSFQFYTNYDKALIKSREKNKPIFLMILSSNCPHCINFTKSLIKKYEVLNYIQSNFITLLIDITENNHIPPYIDYNGFVPYFVVLLPNGYQLAPSIKGEIDINSLYDYLYNSLILYRKLLKN